MPWSGRWPTACRRTASCRSVTRFPTPMSQPKLFGLWDPPERVGDLFALHEHAGIELRVLNNLWPFWDVVTTTTLGFSAIRMVNARGHSAIGLSMATAKRTLPRTAGVPVTLVATRSDGACPPSEVPG